MGGEGRGKKKKRDSNLVFREKNEKRFALPLYREIRGRMDGWKRRFPTYAGNSFRRSRKKKKGKWKKGNDVDVDAENDISGFELERRRGGRERE